LNNIISAKRNSAIFLATLLVLGTIATISPSFMVEAQAEPFYGMDDRYDSYEEEYTDNNNYEPIEYPSYKPEYPSDNSYKSKDSSSTIINKVKCNNINSNNNGVDVNLGIPNNDALVEAQAAYNEGQEITANGWGNDNGYKQNDNGFKFVCVNNNDNENNIIVINKTTPIPPTPPDTITCEECFTDNENLTPVQLEAINRVLAEIGPLTVGFFETQISVDDLTALCTLLTLSSTEENLRNSVFQLIATANSAFLDPSEIIDEPVADEIVQCIIEALANEA
jgi:hypothetical protein